MKLRGALGRGTIDDETRALTKNARFRLVASLAIDHSPYTHVAKYVFNMLFIDIILIPSRSSALV